MAITLIEPARLSFAGNPIIFKAKTSKSLAEGESFLRIVCTATFTLNGSPAGYDGITSFKIELSQPVENGGTAVFNLADASQTLLCKVQTSIDMNSGDGLAAYSVMMNPEFKEVFIFDNYEHSGKTEYGKLVYVVPGAFTDYELLTKSNTLLSSITANGKAMTRKPDGGIVYKGETLIVPMLYGYQDNDDTVVSASVSGTAKIGETVIGSGSCVMENLTLDYLPVPMNGSVEGKFSLTGSLSDSFNGKKYSLSLLSGHYRTNTQGVQFLRFINGFGAVENIAVRSKDKLSYEVSGDTHSLVQGIETRPTDRRYATKTQPVGVYELSSGYVPQKWAEWFVQELLTSPRVWILLGGKWVPALIEAEDDCVIYDRTKPEMPHVDFTLRLAIDGVTGVSW